jgi:predicted lipid-binding transport protein (Tim44 family)
MVEGLLPHFLVLHQMMRRTLAPRISYSEAIPAYERNLLDALMKLVCFDVFEYIVDEIWNIATNHLRSCGFAPYIQFMIESVTQEKFYKDVHHDSLHPTVSKDPRASCAGSSAAPAATPSHTTCSGGAPTAPATNSSILKMLWGIFATCRCTD